MTYPGEVDFYSALAAAYANDALVAAYENTAQSFSSTPLAERNVGDFSPGRIDVASGRRLRAFAIAVYPRIWQSRLSLCSLLGAYHWYAPVEEKSYTIGEAYTAITTKPEFSNAYDAMKQMPLTTGSPMFYSTIPTNYEPKTMDASLSIALQDLADEVNEDIREACFAFNTPNMYYPGVDEGIEPCGEDYVNLIIWGLQRELLRETRGLSLETRFDKLPAVVLSDLPWDIQRALVERRRWRFAQWGITKESQERGYWSLWDVPEDSDYVPRRSLRLSGTELV